MTYPFVPLGTQFTHPTLEDDPGMNAAVDARLNQLRAHALGGMQQALPRLRVVQRATAGVVNGGVLNWDTVIEDTHSGYSVAGAPAGSYTIPATGSYMIQGQWKQTTAVQVGMSLAGVASPTGEFRSGAAVIEGPKTDAVSAMAGELPLLVVRLTAGQVLTTLSVVLSGSPQTGSDAAADVSWWHVFGVTPG